MNAPLFFDNAGDDRVTPQPFFDALNAEFHFDLDAAADEHNHKCDLWYGKGGIEFDALEADWGGLTCWLNPPYSSAGAFVAKAREEADKGATVVMLIPARTDTKYWHKYIWDKDASRPNATVGDPYDGWFRPGVRVRFIPGRLQFGLIVPATLRAWLKSEYKAATQDLEGWLLEDAITAWYRAMVEVTGLPRMAISRILDDFEDNDLLDGAPFPSCVVIFTKVEKV